MIAWWLGLALAQDLLPDPTPPVVPTPESAPSGGSGVPDLRPAPTPAPEPAPTPAPEPLPAPVPVAPAPLPAAPLPDVEPPPSAEPPSIPPPATHPPPERPAPPSAPEPVQPPAPASDAVPEAPAQGAEPTSGEVVDDNGTWLLDPPRQSRWRALSFLLGMVGAIGVARSTHRLRMRLREGLVARFLQIVETVARTALVLAGVGLVAQLIPPALLPALPWAMLAAAAALGWSVRDALPDLVAWAQLSAEGAVRKGQWVRGEGFAGRVSHLGLRATRIDDGHGRTVSVPNRQLATRPLVSDVQRWPTVEVEVRLPGVEPASARRALHQAALLSPWIAPHPAIEVAWDSVDPDRWTLRVRLLEGSFAESFRGAFRERLRDLLPR